jgi:hypothetical protein
MPASQCNPAGRIARFGLFELDLVAGELRKNGAKLRLQEQPFQLLALLLERSGDVVTREELRQKLWPAAGFDYRRLGEKFQQMFPFILALDQLWAIAPFLLMQKIGLGAAFAASAGLLYVPFSERTLIRMAYVSNSQ